MNELLVISALFLVSLLSNALVAKWSTEKVLGVDVSIVKSLFLVGTRSLAGLLAGFAVGYTVSFIIQGDVQEDLLMFVAMVIVSFLSFGVYWLLLGRLTGKKISFWAVTKTVAAETIYMVVFIIALAIFLSILFFFLFHTV